MFRLVFCPLYPNMTKDFLVSILSWSWKSCHVVSQKEPTKAYLGQSTPELPAVGQNGLKKKSDQSQRKDSTVCILKRRDRSTKTKGATLKEISSFLLRETHVCFPLKPCFKKQAPSKKKNARDPHNCGFPFGFPLESFNKKDPSQKERPKSHWPFAKAHRKNLPSKQKRDPLAA